MARKIILDCDPGIDDAMAIAYAVGSAGIELAGITTVAGNVGLDKTTANALRLRDFLGAPAVPVTAGAARSPATPPITSPGRSWLRPARSPWSRWARSPTSRWPCAASRRWRPASATS